MTIPKSRVRSDTYRVVPDSTATRVRNKLIAKIKALIAGSMVKLAARPVKGPVRYAGGSKARLVFGAGVASVYKGRPMALTGSELDNGDRITGLLDPSYVPPQFDGEQHG